MDENPKRSWWRKRGWITAAALWLALPVLYVLGVGPAHGYERLGYLDRKVFPSVWRPVIRAGRTTRFGDVLYPYLDLWQPPDRPGFSPSIFEDY